MSYVLNHANGQNPIILRDGKIDTSTNLTFIGKNYENYGGLIDQNFLYLLENFANSTAPSKPVTGQLWYNTTTKQLNVFNGNQYKSAMSVLTGTTQPVNPDIGDMWFDVRNAGSPQLRVWTGTDWYAAGSGGVSGVNVENMKDVYGFNHIVVSFNIAGSRYVILSKDAEFIPQESINGFARVLPGLNIAAQSYVSNNRFVGQASDSLKLSGLYSNSYMRSDTNTSTTGSLSILNNVGLNVGTLGQGKLQVVNNNFSVSSTINGASLKLGTKINNSSVDAIVVTGRESNFTGNVSLNYNLGIGTTNPNYNLHIVYSNTNYGSGMLINNTATSGFAYARMDLISSSNSPFVLAQDQNGNGRINNFANAGIIFSTFNTNRAMISNTGNVGINTVSPNALIHVFSNNNSTVTNLRLESGLSSTTSPRITFADSRSGNNNQTYEINNGTVAGGLSITDVTNDVSRLLIDNTGNIGVGTITPTVQFDVYNPVDNAAIYVRSNNGDAFYGRSASDGFAAYDLYNVNGSEAARISVDNTSTITFNTTQFTTPRVSIEGGTGKVGIGINANLLSQLNVKSLSLTNFLGNLSSQATLLGDGIYTDRFTALDFSEDSITPHARIAMQYTSNGSKLAFGLSNSYANGITLQAMTLSYTGDLFLNTILGTYQNNNSMVLRPASGYGLINHANATASGTRYMGFAYNGQEIGSITQSGNAGVAFNTISDYRVKSDVVALTGSLQSILALKPVNYTWKQDGQIAQGFIAHELAEVIPNAVTGSKDQVDENGNPVYQSVDYSKLVVHLVAALQELAADFADYKSKHP